jgi:hypothetical protein
MAWQLRIMHGGAGPTPYPGEIVQTDLSQSEAEGRAQRLNDGLLTDEYWFVAEYDGYTYDVSQAVTRLRRYYADLTDSEIEVLLFD